jgi:ribonuclease HI
MAIKAYIDGACSGNPGPGGWGVVLLRPDGTSLDLAGYAPQATNNRMELSAAIALLSYLSPDVAVAIYADSKYVVDGVTSWMVNWKRNGWRNAQKKTVENIDLWQRLDALIEQRGSGLLTWHWVKGHAGHTMNERADRLAVAAIANRRGTGPAVDLTGGDPIAPAPVEKPPRVSYARESGGWHWSTRAHRPDEEFLICIEGIDGVIAIRFRTVENASLMRLEVMEDGLAVLLALPGFIEKLEAERLRRGGQLSPDAVEIFLLNQGYVDITSRERPSDAA